MSIVVRLLIATFALGCFSVADLEYAPGIVFLLTLLALSFIVCLFFFWHNKLLRVVYGLFTSLLLGMLFTLCHIARLSVAENFYGVFEGEAIVCALPEQKSSYQQLVVCGEKGREKVIVRVPQYPQFNYGDKISFSGEIEKIEPFVGDNDKIFNYPRYLMMRYKAVAIVKNARNVEKVGENKGNAIVASVYKIKNVFEGTIARTLPEPQAALGQGLLTGTKANFTPRFTRNLQATGTSHIVAISGYNVSIILNIFFNFTKVILGFWPAVVSGLGAVFLFTILTGASASIVRATIMGSLGLVATVLGRQVRIEHTLFIAAFLMLLENPLIVRFDAGFQLSFLAVLGLTYFAPWFKAFLEKIKIYKYIPLPIREAVEATLGAQMVAWPVILFLFGQISVVAPISNALILPIIPLAMFLIFIAAVLAILFPFWGTAFSILPWSFLTIIVMIINTTSRLPGGVATVTVSAWWLVLWFMFIIFFIAKKEGKHLKEWFKEKKYKSKKT